MLFSNGEKGVLSRDNSEWNCNEFCQLFRHTRNAEEFITVREQNTTFNKVTQSAKPFSTESELDRSISQSYDGESVLPSPHTPAPKRPAEEHSEWPVSKKKCTNASVSFFDQAIEAKKAGMFLHIILTTTYCIIMDMT